MSIPIITLAGGYLGLKLVTEGGDQITLVHC